MSQEDDVNFKDLVTEALEKNGVLAKIRAQLRANIFMALEDEQDQSHQNLKLKDALSTNDGVLSFLLVQEFLEFCNLRQTSMVYKSETGQGNSYFYEGRSNLVHSFKTSKLSDKCNSPVLIQIVKILKSSQNDNFANSTANHVDTSNEKSFNESEASPRAGVQNNTFVVNSGRSDNYDLSFTSDSEGSNVTDDRSRLVLPLNLNQSSETNDSSSKESEILISSAKSVNEESIKSKDSQQRNSNEKLESESVKSVSEVNFNEEVSLTFNDITQKSDKIEESIKSNHSSNSTSGNSLKSSSKSSARSTKSKEPIKKNGIDTNESNTRAINIQNLKEFSQKLKDISNKKLLRNGSRSNTSDETSDESISEEIVQAFEYDKKNNGNKTDDSININMKTPEKSSQSNSLNSPLSNLLDETIPETPHTKSRVKDQINFLKHQSIQQQEEKKNINVTQDNKTYINKDAKNDRLIDLDDDVKKMKSNSTTMKTMQSSLSDLPSLPVNKKILPSYSEVSPLEKGPPGLARSVAIDNGLGRSLSKEWTGS